MEENDIGIPDEFKTFLEYKTVLVEALASQNKYSDAFERAMGSDPNSYANSYGEN